MYTYTYTHICIYTCIHIYIYIYIFNIYACMHACMHTYIHTHIHIWCAAFDPPPPKKNKQATYLMRFHGLANRFKHTPETLKNEMGIPLPLGVHFLQVLLLPLPELRIPELFFLVFVTLPPLWVPMLVFFFNFYFFCWLCFCCFCGCCCCRRSASSSFFLQFFFLLLL